MLNLIFWKYVYFLRGKMILFLLYNMKIILLNMRFIELYILRVFFVVRNFNYLLRIIGGKRYVVVINSICYEI